MPISFNTTLALRNRPTLHIFGNPTGKDSGNKIGNVSGNAVHPPISRTPPQNNQVTCDALKSPTSSDSGNISGNLPLAILTLHSSPCVGFTRPPSAPLCCNPSRGKQAPGKLHHTPTAGCIVSCRVCGEVHRHVLCYYDASAKDARCTLEGKYVAV